MKRIGFIYWLTGFCVLCSCNSKAENDAQQSAIFGWIMNNTWETNFKMDLSGFSEFRYGVEIVIQSHLLARTALYPLAH